MGPGSMKDKKLKLMDLHSSDKLGCFIIIIIIRGKERGKENLIHI